MYPEDKRVIIHIDMDAFFAAVEQRDHKEYREKPLIISGDINRRSVVSTCSYEARKYGIYSSMPAKTAYRLCPNGIYIHPDMKKYKRVSESIFDIYHEYTELVEPLSVDEAFLDVSALCKDTEEGVALAKEIKRRIYEKEQLTASAGVSFNKFIAKIASDYRKPDGLTEITTKNFTEFLDSLSIDKFFGIGKVTAAQLKNLGVTNGRELRELSEEQLRMIMHSRGSIVYEYIRGEDHRPVEPNRKRKSLGKETTLDTDITLQELPEYLRREAVLLEKELLKKGVKGYTVVMKVKYADFTEFTRRITKERPVQSQEELMECMEEIIREHPIEDKPIRLVGITVTKFADKEEEYQQMSLWDIEESVRFR